MATAVVSCSYGLKMRTLSSTRIIITVFAMIMTVPTTLLNALVLIAIWKNPTLHKPSHILLANLALTDLLIGAVTCPYIAYANLVMLRKWYNGFCDSWIILGPFSYCLGALSLYTLAVISVDRFLAIKLKFTYRTVVTNKRVISVLLFGWFVSGGLYIFSVVLLFNNISSDAFVTPVMLYAGVLVCAITLCYSMAFYHLKKVSSQVSPSDTNEPTTPNASPNFNVTKYRRSLHTMLIVLSAIFSFYLPFLLVAFLKRSFESDTVESLTRISELLIASNSCVNPILYLWRMEDLRQAVQATVRRLLRF